MKRILMTLIASFAFTAQALAGVAAPNLSSTSKILNPSAEGLKVSMGEIHFTSLELSANYLGSSLSATEENTVAGFRWDWGFAGFQSYTFDTFNAQTGFVGYRDGGLTVALSSTTTDTRSSTGLSYSWALTENFVIGAEYSSHDDDTASFVFGLAFTEPGSYNLAYDTQSYTSSTSGTVSASIITAEGQYEEYILGYSLDDQYSYEGTTRTDMYLAYEPESGLIAKVGTVEIDNGTFAWTGNNLSLGFKF